MEGTMVELTPEGLFVAVRARDVQKAQKEGKGIIIVNDRDRMVIDYDNLNTEVICMSDRPIYDKVSKHSYHLYFYKWEPIAHQLGFDDIKEVNHYGK